MQNSTHYDNKNEIERTTKWPNDVNASSNKANHYQSLAQFRLNSKHLWNVTYDT